MVQVGEGRFSTLALRRMRGLLSTESSRKTFKCNDLEAEVGIGHLDRRFEAKMAQVSALLKRNRPLLAPTSADWFADVFPDSAQRGRMLRNPSIGRDDLLLLVKVPDQAHS